MSAMFVMIIASLAIALAFLGAFIWSVRKGHYDDDYTPSVRILFDDPNSDASVKNNTKDIH
ncbi:cbb3-type cytochrome oxidase assembly protein CcoS [Dyadobacter chenwenxiniae]|uniref:Cbb3-type cytochrome oxidase assembly protein CcoS n=1 Tax=Dyadobacter chenwenxiniae TaxID=2906456 RepID=A0A9X1PKI5_9BACT|nr:cbb3-type cytochrome oxidase assembly protein CcoS [Dyadobacter chenwenxiniae]MCF0062603.1 cbb3-type cytochrome oxidase assembly protein CcoS [Dyadobacter chenwenxiniae]UON83650.1 cbb3-type cytochrome oxidase assembly protein CcoS [Dyadobacter chenwenxiniae]